MTRSPLSEILSYNSVKLITVKNKWLGATYYGTALLILVYVFVYTIGVKKGYQEYDDLVGSTLLKVKGSAFTGVGDNMTVYDSGDLVIPPLSPDTLFITTSQLITPNQKRGTCAGNDPSQEACCNGVCCAGAGVATYNGVTTGKCVINPIYNTSYCELRTWCPLEDERSTILVPINGVRRFSIFIRANVRFPVFNIARTTAPNNDIKSGINQFYVEDILASAGSNFDAIATKGAIIMALVRYDCDLNKGTDSCDPTVSFIQLDDATGSGGGFNYRYTSYSTGSDNVTPVRTLTKVYGMRLVIRVVGRAGRFGIVPLLLNLGSGLALMGTSTILCDILMQYILPQRKRYHQQKFQEVSEEGLVEFRGDADIPVDAVTHAPIIAPPSSSSSSSSSIVNPVSGQPTSASSAARPPTSTTTTTASTAANSSFSSSSSSSAGAAASRPPPPPSSSSSTSTLGIGGSYQPPSMTIRSNPILSSSASASSSATGLPRSTTVQAPIRQYLDGSKLRIGAGAGLMTRQPQSKSSQNSQTSQGR